MDDLIGGIGDRDPEEGYQISVIIHHKYGNGVTGRSQPEPKDNGFSGPPDIERITLIAQKLLDEVAAGQRGAVG